MRLAFNVLVVVCVFNYKIGLLLVYMYLDLKLFRVNRQEIHFVKIE